MIYRFADCELDTRRHQLIRSGESIEIEPKMFAVLTHLLEHRGELITRDELFDHFWPSMYVSDGTLTRVISHIRHAIGQDGAHKLIETVHRKGYRFIAGVEHVDDAPAASNLLSTTTDGGMLGGVFVGRTDELKTLDEEYRLCHQGERRLVFVAGDAGIGKSALIEAWAGRLDNASGVRVVTGCCVDQFGAGEAYLPFFDLIRSMCSWPDDGTWVVDTLRHVAPTWLLQLPALQREDERDTLREQVLESNAERMRRELADLLETLSAEQPLVLVVEDMHWCDASSAAALAVLANRREPARLLIIASYRGGDLAEHVHPFARVCRELKVQRRCHELALERLTEHDIGKYLSARFAGRASPPLATAVYARTEGYPLFMVALSDHLAGAEDAFVPQAIAEAVPDDLAEFIALRVEQLDNHEQLLLGAASVAGPVFTVAEVLAALGDGWEQEAVERVCEALCKRGEFLAELDIIKWPDSTITGRYAFRHALYPEVLYGRVAGARRARLHRAIGERLEQGYAADTVGVASALAGHFERGQDVERAARYLLEAAASASARYANLEASQLLQRGLALVESNAIDDELGPLEMPLLLALGPVLTALDGYGAAAVAATYDRARYLCASESMSSHRHPVLRGLSSFYVLRADYATAHEIGSEILESIPADDSMADGLYVEGHLMCGAVDYFTGQFSSSREQLGLSLGYYDSAKHRSHAMAYGIEPGVLGSSWRAVVNWMLGDPQAARCDMQQALELAVAADHDFSLCQCYAMVAFLQQLRGDVAQTILYSDLAAALAAKRQFAFLIASEQARRGWVWVQQGDVGAGIDQICEGIAMYRDTGAVSGLTALQATLVEAYLYGGQIEHGLAAADDALALARKNAEGFYEAELLRLAGELARAAGDGEIALAEQYLQNAVVLARRQQARAWEVRAGLSLAELHLQQGDRQAAHDLLTPMLGALDEYAAADQLARVQQVLAAASSGFVTNQ